MPEAVVVDTPFKNTVIGQSISRSVQPGTQWVTYYKGWIFTDVEQDQFEREHPDFVYATGKMGDLLDAMIPWMESNPVLDCCAKRK